MYHATTRLSPAELSHAIATAKNQDQRLLVLFRRYGPLSPSMALRHWVAQGWREVPLTSIRRGISDLTSEGRLTKTGLQVKGAFNMPEGVWKLADESAQAAA